MFFTLIPDYEVLNFQSFNQSEAVSARVVMTDENFLETKNVALQGTHCVSGSGLGLVVQTGDRTVFGVIAKLSSAGQARMTTLQRELVRFVAIIACFAIAVAILIVILWAAWYVEYYNWISKNNMLQASSFFPRYH
jgi:sodium/potassium-transporting ATPase subunit alpha